MKVRYKRIGKRTGRGISKRTSKKISKKISKRISKKIDKRIGKRKINVLESIPPLPIFMCSSKIERLCFTLTGILGYFVSIILRERFSRIERIALLISFL